MVSTVAYDFLDGDGVLTTDSILSSWSSGMLSGRKGGKEEVLEEGDLPENFNLPGDSGNAFNGWSLAMLRSGMSNAKSDKVEDGEKGAGGMNDVTGDTGDVGTASARRLYPKPEGWISSEADFTVDARAKVEDRKIGLSCEVRVPAMVSYGMTWFDSVALLGPGQGKTRHDTTRHDTTRHDTTRHDTTRHDTT